MNLQHYLNDHVVDDDDSIRAVQDRLELGQLVIIPDAFRTDFAELVHDQLFHHTNYSLEEGYHADGYTHLFHTIKDDDNDNNNNNNMSPILRHVNDIFSSIDTRTFLTQFTDLDCLGDTILEPTYHAPGHFENPHTADEGQHNIAFLWLLSKDWQPEWGGALYWCQETPDYSYVHATFNTLVLFKVTTRSKHMITKVSTLVADSGGGNGNGNGSNGNGGKQQQQPQRKRLAYNGFWTGGWVPEAEDDLEEQLEQNGDKLTRRQFETMEELLEQEPSLLSEERRTEVRALFEEELADRYPPSPRYIFELDANELSGTTGGTAAGIVSES